MEERPRHEHDRDKRIDSRNEEDREAELDAIVGAAALEVMVWSFIGWVAWAGVLEPWVYRGMLPSGGIIAALFLFGLGPAVVTMGVLPERRT